MTIPPGHKRAQHLIEGDAYRRIMAGEASATLAEFAANDVGSPFQSKEVAIAGAARPR
jgi:hypothetical protein